MYMFKFISIIIQTLMYGMQSNNFVIVAGMPWLVYNSHMFGVMCSVSTPKINNYPMDMQVVLLC